MSTRVGSEISSHRTRRCAAVVTLGVGTGAGSGSGLIVRSTANVGRGAAISGRYRFLLCLGRG